MDSRCCLYLYITISDCQYDDKLPKLYYTIEEVMEMLGVGRNKVYAMLYEGTMPRKKIGKQYRIPVDSFNEWATTPDH
tara:strand:- start:262 stop:495 length:234 start_codon:yes stop_codon:yes gene_type:complete